MGNAALYISVTAGLAVIGLVWTLGQWKGKVDAERTSFKDFMSEIRQNINAIRSDIKDDFHRLSMNTPISTAQSHSPIRLNDLGQKISEKLGAKSWAESEGEKLVGKVSGKDAFEIRSFAFQYADNYESDERLLKEIRKIAFDHGITLIDVTRVLGLELRDVLMREVGMEHLNLDT